MLFLYITIGPGDFRRNTWPPSFFLGGGGFGVPVIYKYIHTTVFFFRAICDDDWTLLEFLSVFFFCFCVVPSSLSVMKLGEIFFGGIPTNNIC